MKIKMKELGHEGDPTIVYLTTDDDINVKAKVIAPDILQDHVFNLMDEYKITSVNTETYKQ
tara:strand:- start:6658 stop:6840 length:183 start_codon:yes stop_codon:yes gene_type:complete